MHVPCVRCGHLVLTRRAEAVGAGYRCDLCSTIAIGEDKAREPSGRVAARRAVGGGLACVAVVPALALAGLSPSAAVLTGVLAVGAIATVLLAHVAAPARKQRAPVTRKSVPRST